MSCEILIQECIQHRPIKHLPPQIYFILPVNGGQETSIFKAYPKKRRFYNELSLHAKRILYNKATSMSPGGDPEKKSALTWL